jgi:hypothetical protein
MNNQPIVAAIGRSPAAAPSNRHILQSSARPQGSDLHDREVFVPCVA